MGLRYDFEASDGRRFYIEVRNYAFRVWYRVPESTSLIWSSPRVQLLKRTEENVFARGEFYVLVSAKYASGNFVIPFWHLLILGLLCRIVGLIDRNQSLAIRHICPSCGYDLRGSPGITCSECGSQADYSVFGRLDAHLQQTRPIFLYIVIAVLWASSFSGQIATHATWWKPTSGIGGFASRSCGPVGSLIDAIGASWGGAIVGQCFAIMGAAMFWYSIMKLDSCIRWRAWPRSIHLLLGLTWYYASHFLAGPFIWLALAVVSKY